MQIQDYRCRQTIAVRAAEVDAQKIVYNAHYATYADVAASAYWRLLAIAHPSEWCGGSLRVQHLTTTFYAPAALGDVLTVGLRCTQSSAQQLHMQAGIFRGEQLLNAVELVYELHDAQHQRLPLPEDLIEVIAAFEAGEDMVRLHSGNWNDWGRQAERLRMEVFVREQGVPREIEIDEFDPVAWHVVALNRLGQPVGTGRLVSDAPGVARIGRMAVARHVRGTRVGRQVLDALVDFARQRGDREAVLHAQLHAQSFYARAGFVPEGQVYEEAGIAHITMRQRLQ